MGQGLRGRLIEINKLEIHLLRPTGASVLMLSFQAD